MQTAGFKRPLVVCRCAAVRRGTSSFRLIVSDHVGKPVEEARSLSLDNCRVVHVGNDADQVKRRGPAAQ